MFRLFKVFLFFVMLVTSVTLVACSGQPTQTQRSEQSLLPREEQQKAVLTFQNQLIKYDQDAIEKAWKPFTKLFDSYTRRPTILPAADMYEIAMSVQKACDLTGASIAATPIPEGLPPDVTNALAASRTKLAEAWALRESGVGDFMKFIETLRPSYAAAAREKFEYAKEATAEAAETLVVAKSLVGITGSSSSSSGSTSK